MRDYKYTKLVTGNPKWGGYMTGFGAIQHEQLKPLAAAFALSLMRSGEFAVLPVELTFQRWRDDRFQANAIFKATGKGEVTLDEICDFQFPQAVHDYFDQQWSEFEKKSREYNAHLRSKVGLFVVETFLKKSVQMQRSMEALFTSITLESWLFFEALLSDLWATGVDHGGKSIANRIDLYKGWINPDENIKATDAPNLQFNAKTHRGSYMREIGKVSFNKLRDIRRFYGAAFGNGAEKIFDTVAGGKIRLLYAVRNIILHSAGKVDSQFKTAVQQFHEYDALNIGEPFLLDGELVKDLRNVSAEVGLACLDHVDAILRRED